MNLITAESSPQTTVLPRLTTTVPKEYVHRASLAEVFLTSCTAHGDLTYTLTGQWPRAHPYFTTPDGTHHDPLQVAETFRQAGMTIAHTALDVPLGHHFILWSLSHTTHPNTLTIGPTPTDFTIHAHCTHLNQRRNTINRATLHYTLHRNNTPIAHGNATFTTINPTIYTRLRGTPTTAAAATGTANTAATPGTTPGTPTTARTTTAASTTTTAAAEDTTTTHTAAGTAAAAAGTAVTPGTTPGSTTTSSSTPAAGTACTSGTPGTGATAATNTAATTITGPRQPMTPASVNRRTPADVVLTPTGQPHQWLLTPNLDHPTLFDHAGDHIPGMVLIEAAHQAAYNTANTPHYTPTHTTTHFHHYTELDQPCTIHTTHHTHHNNHTTTEITGTQNNQTTFTTTITATTTPPT
ncbi:AfsA-related hotdog domain-containing protein, partial [Streptomyces sp. NPDC001914]|uniref:AfsA-related hotdog domain-containing protein n=1 Tax=Streptomyces sp. NPDC001914 TaxID=3364623 RepID=UPI0036AD9530